MKISLSTINFCGEPKNYAVIDKYLSRSAQPQKEDLSWLKEQGVTDIINFRTMYAPDIDFDEKAEVEKLGMKYHNIPSITRYPKEENVDRFLKQVETVGQNGGKVHIHCKAGADRTGMYSYIYKSLKGLGGTGVGARIANQIEMIRMGHNMEIYPDLLPWTNKLVNKLLGKLGK